MVQGIDPVVDVMMTASEWAVAKVAIDHLHMLTKNGKIQEFQQYFPWSTPKIFDEMLIAGRKELSSILEMEKVLQAHSDELENQE